jgi:hypothetical protein
MTSPGASPDVSTTSMAPPATGTARSAVKMASATNCTITTCQFAAVINAPRFSASFGDAVRAIGGDSTIPPAFRAQRLVPARMRLRQ